jgi:hypothetical protein
MVVMMVLVMLVLVKMVRVVNGEWWMVDGQITYLKSLALITNDV